MIVNEISLVIQNKNDIRKLMADKKTKESSQRSLIVKIKTNSRFNFYLQDLYFSSLGLGIIFLKMYR